MFLSVPFEVKPLVPAPSDPIQWPAWCKALQEKREQMKNHLVYDDTAVCNGRFDIRHGDFLYCCDVARAEK